MRLSISFLIAALAFTIAAAPTKVLSPRACTTVTPEFLQQLDSSKPGISYINQVKSESFGGDSSIWITRDTTNTSSPYRSVQFVDFPIPQNAHTCTLHLSDIRSTLQYTKNNQVSQNAPQLNIISLVPNALRANPTYDGIFNSYPSVISAQSFSTVSLRQGDGSRVLNSEACPGIAPNGGVGRLQFVLEFVGGINGNSWESGSQGGRDVMVLGQASPAVLEGGGINGVYMTYNC